MGWHDWQAIHPLTDEARTSITTPVEARKTEHLLALVENHYLVSLSPPVRPWTADVTAESNALHARLDAATLTWALRILRHPDFDARAAGMGILWAASRAKKIDEVLLVGLLSEIQRLLHTPIEEDAKELETCDLAIMTLKEIGEPRARAVLAAFVEAPGDKTTLVDEHGLGAWLEDRLDAADERG